MYRVKRKTTILAYDHNRGNRSEPGQSHTMNKLMDVSTNAMKFQSPSIAVVHALLVHNPDQLTSEKRRFYVVSLMSIQLPPEILDVLFSLFVRLFVLSDIVFHRVDPYHHLSSGLLFISCRDTIYSD